MPPGDGLLEGRREGCKGATRKTRTRDWQRPDGRDAAVVEVGPPASDSPEVPGAGLQMIGGSSGRSEGAPVGGQEDRTLEGQGHGRALRSAVLCAGVSGVDSRGFEEGD